MQSCHRDFYEMVYKDEQYSNIKSAKEHPFYDQLSKFIQQHDLTSQKCLEVGSGRGAFQDLVRNYTGIDTSMSVKEYYHKQFVCSSAESIPFDDSVFDAAWSYAVLEHIEDPEAALAEIRRVIRPGGLLLLRPAWQCRPWAADGYPVRPYSDFGAVGKLIKATIPIRDSVIFRSCHVFPRRLSHLFRAAISGAPQCFHYRRLKANFDKFWMADSDAMNSIDPYDAILWFTSRGDGCLSHASPFTKFFVRSGCLTIRIKK
jgi:SAM-dependent methyltransferase